MSKLQKQLDQYKLMLSPPALATSLVPADGMAPPRGDVDPALLTIPSPPESRPASDASRISDNSRSVDSISSIDSFSDIFGLHSARSQEMNCSDPDKHIADLVGPAGDQPITPIRSRSVGHANGGFCDAAAADEAAHSNADNVVLSSDIDYIRSEVESLRTQVNDFDDRLVSVEMTSITLKELFETARVQSKTVKDSFQRQIDEIKETASRNVKSVKKLSSKVKRSQKGSVESTANIECNNRFAVFENITESNDGRTNDRANCDLALSKSKRQKSNKTQKGRQSKPKPISVKIIGASMVRGQGKLLNDPKRGIQACCYPNPGYTAEQIQERLPGMISQSDDVVVLLGGTNNVPRDTVPECITKLNRLIDSAQYLNRRAHIAVSEIPIRFDDISLNDKIERLNVFIRHKCTKSTRLHVVNHSDMFRADFGRDGLHFSEVGRAKFADATRQVVKDITKH